MPPAHVTYGSGRTVSFASLAVAFDADAIKTSIGATAGAVVYSGADLNGVVGGAVMNPPRSVTVTRTSSAGDYTLTPIVVTGTYNGATVTDTLTPATADGGDTLYGDQPFDAIVSIARPAQVNTDGAFTFGTGDVWAGFGKQFRAVKAHAAGNLALLYDTGVTDTLVVAAHAREDVMPRAVLASGTTAAGFTVYY